MILQSNIDRKTAPEDWRLREAATFAFGSILEGPSPQQLVQLVAMGLNFFLAALKDPNSQVRHTTAWTIGAASLSPFSFSKSAGFSATHGQLDLTHKVAF